MSKFYLYYIPPLGHLTLTRYTSSVFYSLCALKYVDCIFLKIADQSYLVKIVLIMHNKCSQAVIAKIVIQKYAPNA